MRQASYINFPNAFTSYFINKMLYLNYSCLNIKRLYCV